MLRRIFVQASLILAIFSGLTLWSAPALADCTPAERAQADRWLWLNARDKKASVEQNLPWGVPVPQIPVSNERQLIQWDYVIGYDADLKVPVWTGERVIGSSLGKVGRSDCFRKDVRLKSADASTPADYKERIFDQGHVTPNGNMTMSKIAVHNSFIMSNMTPQFCQFNSGVWKILEELVRRWAVARETVYVFTGSIFDRNGDGARDADEAALRMLSNNKKKRVAIPSAFYKIVAIERPDGTVETVSILLPHDQTDLDRAEAVAYLEQHITTIAQIERLSAMDIFPDLPSAVEGQTLWPFTGQPPRSLARNERCEATSGAVIE